jgi:hypothetical protein
MNNVHHSEQLSLESMISAQSVWGRSCDVPNGRLLAYLNLWGNFNVRTAVVLCCGFIRELPGQHRPIPVLSVFGPISNSKLNLWFWLSNNASVSLGHLSFDGAIQLRQKRQHQGLNSVNSQVPSEKQRQCLNICGWNPSHLVFISTLALSGAVSSHSSWVVGRG